MKFWEMLQDGVGPKKSADDASDPRPNSSAKKPSWLPWRSSTTSTGHDAGPGGSADDEARQQSTHDRITTGPRTGRTVESLAMSEMQFPTTMSCRDAFDYAWHCNSIGGQLTSVYRDGTARDCSDKWDDWWFCMRTRTYGAQSRADAIRAHYRAREAAKYGTVDPATGRLPPSSEDIWASRKRPVEPDSVFRAPFPTMLEEYEEALRQEILARERIRAEESREREE